MMGKSWDIEDPLERFFQQKCIRQRHTIEKLLSYQLINLIGEKKHIQLILFMFHFWRGQGGEVHQCAIDQNLKSQFPSPKNTGLLFEHS